MATKKKKREEGDGELANYRHDEERNYRGWNSMLLLSSSFNRIFERRLHFSMSSVNGFDLIFSLFIDQDQDGVASI